VFAVVGSLCLNLTCFGLANVWFYQVRFLTDYREGKPIAYIKGHLVMMKWLLAILVIGISVIVTSCSSQLKNSRSRQLFPIGSEVVSQIAKGEYNKVTERFDQIMLSSLPPDKLQQTWETLTGRLGPFQGQTGLRYEKLQEYDVVVVKCAFANAHINVRIAFNDKNQIGGLYFVPSNEP
jgi:Protein of unknown function (DUF3887)